MEKIFVFVKSLVWWYFSIHPVSRCPSGLPDNRYAFVNVTCAAMYNYSFHCHVIYDVVY